MASKAYRQDYQKAREAAYRYASNPFEEGTRIWRLCEKARQQKSIFDAMDDEMEAVYGPIGTKRAVVDNDPGSFLSKDSRPAIVDNIVHPA